MTQSGSAWQDLAKRLESRRVELDPRYSNLSEFSRATGVHYKTLQRAEGGKPHQFGRGTLAALDAAYGYLPGSIESMLAGGEPVPMNAHLDADPLPAAEGAPAEPPEGTGHMKGWPLRPHEELWWEPQDPSLPGSPAIRYIYRRTDPSTGDYVESSKGMDPTRSPEEVAAIMREHVDRFHGPLPENSGEADRKK